MQNLNIKELAAARDMLQAQMRVLEAQKADADPERFLPIAEPDLGTREIYNLIDAYQSTWVSSTGQYVVDFEKRFAEYCGAAYGITASNGTAALHLALTALGIGEGDEVIVPDITFASTANAVIYTGAKPVLVDIEKDSWCIAPEEIEKAIHSNTKAIIPVHIYGQACDMEAVMDIANRHGLFVIEDCAEAHGAEFDGKKVGSFGAIGCFSFYGNKIITTGEGGMCITNDTVLNEKMRQLRDHGMNKQKRYYHDAVGFNYRITNLQAAVGLAQLEDIENKLRWRKKLEDTYRELLEGIDGIHLQAHDIPRRTKVSWLVTAYTDDHTRQKMVLESMKMNHIDARPFFIPLSKMEIYKQYKFSDQNSKDISERGFNLPTTRNMGQREIDRVIDAIKSVL